MRLMHKTLKLKEVDCLKENTLLEVIDDATRKIVEIQSEDAVETIKNVL